MSAPLTGLPDFSRMSRKTLEQFRRDARHAKEIPCDANNYFTSEFNTQPLPQPKMWQPCAIAKCWCDYHGPCAHTTDKCQTYHDPGFATPAPAPKSPPRVQQTKRTQQRQKPKIDLRAMILEERQQERALKVRKMQEKAHLKRAKVLAELSDDEYEERKAKKSKKST